MCSRQQRIQLLPPMLWDGRIDIRFYEFTSQGEGQKCHVVIRDASDIASFDNSFPPSGLRNFYFRNTNSSQALSNVALRIDPKVQAKLLSSATTITQPNAKNSTEAQPNLDDSCL
jgi:hypothetical protein